MQWIKCGYCDGKGGMYTYPTSNLDNWLFKWNLCTKCIGWGALVIPSNIVLGDE